MAKNLFHIFKCFSKNRNNNNFWPLKTIWNFNFDVHEWSFIWTTRAMFIHLLIAHFCTSAAEPSTLFKLGKCMQFTAPSLYTELFERRFPLFELLEPSPWSPQWWVSVRGEATGAGFGLSEKENVPVRVSWAVGIDGDLCTSGDVKGSGHWFSVSLWSRVSQHWPYWHLGLDNSLW